MQEVRIASIEELGMFAKTLIEGIAPLPHASVIALSGELGAGKTALAKEIARVLGISETVGSPTFLVMRRYELSGGRWKALVHLDAYRVDDPEELSILKLEEVLDDEETLVIIEWADRVSSLIPDDALWVMIESTGESTRTIRYGKKDHTH